MKVSCEPTIDFKFVTRSDCVKDSQFVQVHLVSMLKGSVLDTLLILIVEPVEEMVADRCGL